MCGQEARPGWGSGMMAQRCWVTLQDGAFHADAGKCLCQPGGDTGEVGGAGAGRYFVEWFSSASGGLEGFVPIPPAEQIPSLLSS